MRAALRIVASVVLAQAAWFTCVVSAAHGEPGFGVMAAAFALSLHFATSRECTRQALVVAMAVAVGLVWDSTLARTGIVEYASPGLLPQWAPLWILALWALFATMLGEPLRWLRGRPLLAAVMGAFGGGLSYASASRLGACRFPDAGLAMLVIGAGWGLLTPLLMEAARRVHRRPAAVSVSP